jgi:uncharacterized protein involved in exopolysaccharide biosynthesis
MPSTMGRDTFIGSAAQGDPELPISALVRPYRRRWRLVLAITAVAWVGAFVAVLVPPRRYTASMVLAAVPNARTSALSGGLTAILGSAQLGGIQSTPYFIAKLLLLRSVITEVASERVKDARGGTVIERVLEQPASKIRPSRIEPAMRAILSAEVDKQTGLISIRATHTDSAVVRQVATRLVETASETFKRVSRAQAASQRAAQGERVDSARRQLRRAEERLVAFLSANRSYTSFSRAAVSRQQLEREVVDARTVYSQARADYDAAAGRELEETPAVVVVDSIPTRLLPDPRRLLLKLVLASALGLLVATLVLWSRGEFREHPSAPSAVNGAGDSPKRGERPVGDRIAASGT